MKFLITTMVCCAMAFSTFAENLDSARVYFDKAILEKNAKRYQVASKLFDKAVEFNPKFVDAYLENGFVNLEMRRTDAAKYAFTKVNELDPNNNIAIQQLTELFYSYRQFSKAIEYAQKCKNYPAAEKIIGLSSYEQEDYPTAVSTLQAYLAKNPKDAQAIYTIGRSYLEMEEYKKAVPFYKQAVEADPAKNAWAYELGLLSYNNDDFKNAVIYFNKAAENGYNQSADFKENLGFAYIYSNEFEKGEKLLLELIAKKPGNKDMLRDMADAYYKAKQYNKSLEYCQKLMEMDMRDGKALWQAGLCFQKLGEKDRGAQMCDRAIELDPTLAGMRQKNMSAGL
ncbi:tetratricopeptide repeat protein [Ferruginibacter sp. SUN002]|uniref:tetratricopeptide repeat protein n=1 Tax=Ferruginibacter sp. SUN002 TaxID=2937789 RepID=UPI003D35A3E5